MSENFINENIYLFLILSLLTFVLLVIYKKISLHFKLLDSPSKNNIHKFPTPTGAGIVFSLIVLFISILKQYFNFFGNYGELNRFYLFIIVTLIYSTICFYDDFKQMHILTKFCFQIILVYMSLPLLVISADLSILKIIPLKLLILILIISWVYMINFHNFIDGLDGFLTLHSLSFFLANLIIFFHLDIKDFSFFISLVFSAILFVFLFFNKPPAKLFMGDTGSVLIGFTIGLITLSNIFTNIWHVYIILLSYPALDVTLTLLKKVFKKKYLWERLFDYFFLKPVLTHKKSHNWVFKRFLIFNFFNFLNALISYFYDLKFLVILSLFCSFYMLYIFSKR